MTGKLIIDGVEVRSTEDLPAIYRRRFDQYGPSPEALLYTHIPANHDSKISQYAEVITTLLQNDKMHILDIGCGYGSLAHCVPPLLYTGIDVVEPFVHTARANHPHHRFELAALQDYHKPTDLAVLAGVTASVPNPFELVELAWGLAQFGLLVDFNDQEKLSPRGTNPDTKVFVLAEVENQLVRLLGRNFQRFPGPFYNLFLFRK